MQTITTTYCPATNKRGSRIKATASGGGGSRFTPWDSRLSDEDNHKQAAQMLCARNGWTGRMIGGDTKTGKVWVFTAEAEYPHNVVNG